MSMPKRIQAKHLDETAILRALAEAKRKTGHGWMTHWYNAEWCAEPERSLLAAVPSLQGVPVKVLLAKLDAMARRKLIDGCACGCRGDWHLLPKGETLLASPATSPAPTG